METLLCNKIWHGECIERPSVLERDRAEEFLRLITRALDIFFPSHLGLIRFITLEALRRTGGDQKKTAALLGISDRALRYRLASFKPYWTGLAEESEIIR